MAAKGLGALIGESAPPPGELGGGYEEGDELGKGDMESFKAAMDADDLGAACEAMDRYLVARGFKKA